MNNLPLTQLGFFVTFGSSKTRNHLVSAGMLKNTFIHLPGVGRKKELALWEAGILTWDDYEKAFPRQAHLFSDHYHEIESALEKSREALKSGDLDFFAERLPKNEHYRIALAKPHDTLFLDIETTGLSLHYDVITLVGASYDDRYECFISGTDKKHIRRLLERAKCLVTFNGTLFDLKFIEKEFEGIRLPKAHVDLRYLCRRIGLTGGQKAIETEIGLRRPEEIESVVGERAPLLWHYYRMGNREPGMLLVEYNHADVEGMKSILDHAVGKVTRSDLGALNGKSFHRFSDNLSRLSFTEQRSAVRKNRVFVPVYRKKHGPQITYKELGKDIDLDGLRIVGIDLTGSESRATGWALLRGNRSETKLIHTDADIIVETINALPDVVSIDSPLSLPEGRTRVTDDDPKREEAGIMRKCERELKRRGVNVYPSLIPSMQRMTARGIRLAGQFRSLGIPVIESYPGAAQDIMDIPRKRAGLAHLKKGLADFGLEGDFTDSDLSHDELDAITAAAVGLFFWSGRFEALGDEVEDYLIIPDLSISPEEWLSRKVIGFSGAISAGKTTAGRYLEGRGYSYGRFSLELERQLRDKGIEPTREALQMYGEEVNKEPGQRWLCNRLATSLGDNSKVVVDGLRHPEDHAFLIEKYGPASRHVFIEASESVRRNRCKKRRMLVRDFVEAQKHPIESKVNLLKKLASSTLANEGTIRGFHKGIRELIRA